MKEIWKDIPGYKHYRVSNLGKVRSLSRVVTANRGVGFRTLSERVLKQHNTNKNYKQVTLYVDGVQKTISIHLLIAMAFLNHNPNGRSGLFVDHIDGNPSNNNLSNLQLLTNRANTSKGNFKNKTSKYTGVHWCKKDKRFIAKIYINGKSIRLGAFKCELAAAKKYNDKLKEIL